MSIFNAGTLTGNSVFSDSVSSINTIDSYSFKLSSSGSFSAALTGLSADANLKLLSSSNTVLQTSALSGTTSEKITINNLAAGTYYIQVQRGSGSTPYKLNLLSDYAGSSFATAFNAGTLSSSHSFKDFVGSSDTSDVYKVNLSASSGFKAALSNLSANANLKLFNSSGAMLRSSSASGSNAEAINMTSLAPGTYYIRIDRTSGDTNYNLSFSTTIDSETDKLFPADAGVINVKTVYGAKGDGITDDTKAIQKAINDHVGYNNNKKKILYFPAGTYLVSNPLEWKDSSGKWSTALTFQGQHQNKTIIRLKDYAPSYSNPASPKAVIYTASNTGSTGNTAFRNFIEDLTVDTGRGNPGAIGIDYLANNKGAIRNVTIRSLDRQGLAGLNLSRQNVGPALVQNVRIDGFDYGIQAKGNEYGITFDDIVLNNQRKAGIFNSQNILSIQDLTSNNAVPVIQNDAAGGLITVIGGNLMGGASVNSAIVNKGVLYARNVTTSGYQASIDNNGALVVSKMISEFVSHQAQSLFSTGKASLNMPIEDAPTFHDSNLNNWASVTAYGAKPNDNIDDTAAIQAAIDSGKPTVYFPTGTYRISETVQLRGNIRKLMGMESTLLYGGMGSSASQPFVAFRLESGNADAVITEDFNFNGFSAGVITFEQASARTLVIKDWEISGVITPYRSTPGAGRLFIENVPVGVWQFNHPQNIWARQLNPESGNLKIQNNGANLWILGLKTEKPSTVIQTTKGGKTELLGGLLYPVLPVASSTPAFVSIDSQMSLIYAVSAYGSDRDYTIHVRETRQGVTKTLHRNSLLKPTSFRSVVPLYVG
jgi:hypothetical protein